MAKVVDDHGSSPLGPEAVLPAQFFTRAGTDASIQPEKRLMLAVLEDAVATFQRHAVSDTRRSKRLVEEVEEWLGGAESEWPFSFDNICSALDLDPEALRVGMDRWKVAQHGRRKGEGANVYRFPFRRVNGRRHSITGPREYLKKSA